jgi:hypothetical protein
MLIACNNAIGDLVLLRRLTSALSCAAESMRQRFVRL